MPIVVSDTSPIRALHHLGLLSLLERIYGTVFLPDAVAVELRRPNSLCPAIEPADFAFLQVESPKDQSRVRAIEASLDDGEAAALVLALEKAADFVLIDERKGRLYAKRLGLKPVGVLAVLTAAKEQSLVPAIRPLIERLQLELQFRLSDQLISEVLRGVQEEHHGPPLK